MVTNFFKKYNMRKEVVFALLIAFVYSCGSSSGNNRGELELLRVRMNSLKSPIIPNILQGLSIRIFQWAPILFDLPSSFHIIESLSNNRITMMVSRNTIIEHEAKDHTGTN